MLCSRSYFAAIRGLALACAAFATAPSARADGLTGEAIFKKQCASCHGPTGAGTKKAPDPLAGDRSAAQLAKYISETMPEDAPGTCKGPDADKVAAYIHDAFYSRAARDRNKPPRIELARLTVRQYRNAVSDLVNGFRWTNNWGDKRGLRGEYFAARNFRNDKRAIDRLDPEVQFDFGTGSPLEGKIDAFEYCIAWSGAVLAPETGEYIFTLRTEQANRLWVNDMKKPLIDNGVKSGNDTEYKGSIHLIAGHAYPIRLEMTKAKVGVDDSKTNKKRPLTQASMQLLWQSPRSATAVVIPARSLAPVAFPESYVVSTALPPDDRSYGWERGTTISKAWDQATTDAALDAGSYVVSKLNELANTKDGDKDREKKLKEFSLKFVERAFRRPLNDDQKKLYVEHQFEVTKEPEAAIKRIVVLALKSPRFLYREAAGSGDQYDVASRLSFGLWDSLPDQALLQAAAAGKLKTREQVAAQAERMVGDLRAQSKLHEFLLFWLKINQPRDIAKDTQRYPGFDPAVIADLRTSVELLLDDVLTDKAADFRKLLLTEELYLNDRLAGFYGSDLPAEPSFRKVPLGNQPRAGILTHPYIMANFAYTGETSPIHRGVFLVRGILGIGLKPPPEAIVPVAADLHPGMTTRDRVSLQTRSQSCMTCHNIINPLGFTMENYDAVGRYREKDHGKTIDAHGGYLTKAGELKKFDGVRDLARFLATSEEVHASFAEQLFHHFVQQSVRAYGPSQLEVLRKNFAANDFNIRKLAVDVMASSASVGREQAVTINTRADKPKE